MRHQPVTFGNKFTREERRNQNYEVVFLLYRLLESDSPSRYFIYPLPQEKTI